MVSLSLVCGFVAVVGKVTKVATERLDAVVETSSGDEIAERPEGVRLLPS